MVMALREKYPNAQITFVTTKPNAAFLAKIDIIDQVITINDSSLFSLLTSLFKAIVRLIKIKPQVYIDLEVYSNFSTFVALASLAKNRIGFYLPTSSYRTKIYTHTVFYNTHITITEVYMHIAKMLDPKASKVELYPIYKNVQMIDHYAMGDYIVINPNASDLRIERRWHANNFKILAEQLCVEHKDKTIYFIGSKTEADYVNDVLANLSFNNLRNIAGQTTVDELIALIKNAALMITNDTGPMHIALACNTPTIALFGPCAPHQYIWPDNVRVIYKKVYCSPCVHEFTTPPCLGNNICMQKIEVMEVKNLVDEFYNNQRQFILKKLD
jgi:ADP-heptose:LPS heptosyltransferase